MKRKVTAKSLGLFTCWKEIPPRRDALCAPLRRAAEPLSLILEQEECLSNKTKKRLTIHIICTRSRVKNSKRQNMFTAKSIQKLQRGFPDIRGLKLSFHMRWILEICLNRGLFCLLEHDEDHKTFAV